MEKNKILFDGIATQGTKRSKFHGGGEYAKFILRESIRLQYEFDIVFSNALYMDGEIEELLSLNPNYTVYRVDDKKDLYDLIDEKDYQVFYSALPYSYSDYACKAHLIGVIHGLRSIELPWDVYRYKYETNIYKRYIGYLISHFAVLQRALRNRHINSMKKLLEVRNATYITVSNHSKYSIMNIFPFVNNDTIRVFYSPFAIERDKNQRHPSNYYLMVSGNRFEKNVYRAVCAFDKLFSDGKLAGKKIVITGCGKQPFWNNLRNKDKFELLPYVSVQELETLYRNAFCFVYPSLNEGFGYPPLKAMGYGVPVIASSATSIPEVCGYAASYFNPLSIDDLNSRILQMDLDKEFYDRLSADGQKRVSELLQMQEKSMLNLLDFIYNNDKK